MGGGLGIAYGVETPPAIEGYVEAICRQIPPRYEVVIEPGRSLVGDAGVLLTEIQSVKRTPTKTFAICDAAMTELIRPALYQAQHPIRQVALGGTAELVDVVGPVCETADFLARGRELAVAGGELLAIMDCGAYGAVMASNYNARRRPAEILVDGRDMHLARARETLAQLYAGEFRLP
jgi:diaminopimelate decarboxylase